MRPRYIKSQNTASYGNKGILFQQNTRANLVGWYSNSKKVISYFFWIENIWTANICWIIQKRTQNILDKCKFQVMSGVTANDWLEDNKINRGNISWLRTILSQLHQQVQRLSKSHLRSARTGQPITRCHHQGGGGGGDIRGLISDNRHSLRWSI